MHEHVNLSHPDKVADRIAGALIDLAYRNFATLVDRGMCCVTAP